MLYERLIHVILFIVLIVAAESQTSSGDLFTSVHDMEALARQEYRLMLILSNYIRNQQARLKLLSDKLKYLKNARPGEHSIQHIIADPINAFSLVRRLTREWPLILNLMVNNIGIQKEMALLPKEEEMESAVRAFTRLQEVYKLDTTKLALHRTWPFSALTAIDCFELGKYSFKVNHYEVAKSWFDEALKKVVKGDATVPEDKVLAHLFLSTQYSDCKGGTESEIASNMLQNLIFQYPKYTLDQDSAQLFREALSRNCSEQDQSANTEQREADIYYNRAFINTCQRIDIHFSSALRCFYIHYNNPRLLIAPFKMEELYLNPPVLMFHEVISDQEITEMKASFSTVREKCATVDAIEYSEKQAYFRTCDVGWVEDHAIESSARITRRVGDMTNLFMGSSEFNQVASYGLGGEFLLHYDPIPNDDRHFFPDGGRLATLMFYLSDVDRGGFTVFPRLNVAVRPQKRSAVFWFNLDHRGELLDDMLHGGCPVLRGSKWVLNKWIHERGQNSVLLCPSDKIFPKQRYYLNVNE